MILFLLNYPPRLFSSWTVSQISLPTESLWIQNKWFPVGQRSRSQLRRTLTSQGDFPLDRVWSTQGQTAQRPSRWEQTVYFKKACLSNTEPEDASLHCSFSGWCHSDMLLWTTVSNQMFNFHDWHFCDWWEWLFVRWHAQKNVLIFHNISMTKGLCYLWRLYTGQFFELDANKLTC